jgi:predicted RNA-binding Zn-ribbon protein involved in translation (DUF1610 family)
LINKKIITLLNYNLFFARSLAIFKGKNSMESELSNIITLTYFVIGILAVRQLFKRNLLKRCPNCGRIGTFREIQHESSALENASTLDAQEIPSKLSKTKIQLECKNCGWQINQ